MPVTRYLVAGDVGVTDDIEVEGVADLVGVTSIVGHVSRAVGPRQAAQLHVDILDREARIIRVHYGQAADAWLPSQTEQATWRFEIEAESPGQPAFTVPRRQPITLRVRAGLDPTTTEED